MSVIQYDHNLIGLVPAQRRTFVKKGWGSEDWIWNSDRYCGKLLFVQQGMECSYHYHQIKDETFLLMEGLLLVRYSPSLFPVPQTWEESREEWVKCPGIVLQPGDVFHVPPFMRHQFRGLKDSKLIEFSTRHDDADSIRLLLGD